MGWIGGGIPRPATERDGRRMKPVRICARRGAGLSLFPLAKVPEGTGSRESAVILRR